MLDRYFISEWAGRTILRPLTKASFLDKKIEQFGHLREIQSLDNLILGARAETEKAQKRIDFVTDSFATVIEEKDELQEKLSSLKKECAKQEADLDQLINKQESAKETSMSLTSEGQVKAFTDQSHTYAKKQDDLESSLMGLLEDIEASEKLIQEKENFLSGQKETLGEIEKEAEPLKKKKNQEIVGYQKRVDDLIEGLDQRFALVFKNTYAQLRFKSPLSHLSGESCGKCFYKIDKVTQHSVDYEYEIHQCVSCKRVLVPYSANK